MKEHDGLDKFQSALKKHGLKSTAQRIAIHQAMMEMGHASADMVCDWIGSHSQTKVTVASVYNTLSQMAALGIYGTRLSANNKMYFDVNTERHLHMYDCVNHTFRDVINDNLYEALIEKIGSRRFRGYRIEGIDIQFVVHPSKTKYRKGGN